MLKIYLYGYLNRVQSSRRLERETQRNVELMWLTGRLMPDFKTIADFRNDNGPAIRGACRQFMVLCRQLNLFTEAVVAVDGSKFKAVNNRDQNFTGAKLQQAHGTDRSQHHALPVGAGSGGSEDAATVPRQAGKAQREDRRPEDADASSSRRLRQLVAGRAGQTESR